MAGNHVHANKSGKVFPPDCGYQIWSDAPKKIRFPDESFVARGRFPDDKPPRGHIPIAPDWTAEVVSPNDTAEEVETKVVDFLRAGVRLLWVIYPESRTVHVFRANGNPSHLTADDELSGEDVLPGFTCRVAELFEGI